MVTVGDAGTARGQTMPGSHRALTFPLARPPATLQPVEGRRARARKGRRRGCGGGRVFVLFHLFDATLVTRGSTCASLLVRGEELRTTRRLLTGVIAWLLSSGQVRETTGCSEVAGARASPIVNEGNGVVHDEAQ